LRTESVLRKFDAKMQQLEIDTNSRNTMHTAASSRVTRARHGEMTDTGTTLRTRIGGPGWEWVRIGAKWAHMRLELVPTGEPRFDGLGHSINLWDTRLAVETVTTGESRTRGADLGPAVSEGVHLHGPRRRRLSFGAQHRRR
jgi:hypothetical protein